MAVDFRAHPPERRKRPTTVAACCCCCCCCCLHSVAGLLAPAITGRSETEEEQKGTAAYWWCLLVLVGGQLAVAALPGGEGHGERGLPGSGSLAEALLILALCLPAYQLAAALLAAIIGLFCWGPDASRRVGRLAWRGFVGGLIGLGLMAVPMFGLGGSGLGSTLSALGLIVVVWLSIVFRKGARRAAA